MKKPPIRPPPACWFAVQPDGSIVIASISLKRAEAMTYAIAFAEPDAWQFPTWPQLRRSGWRVVRCQIETR